MGGVDETIIFYILLPNIFYYNLKSVISKADFILKSVIFNAIFILKSVIFRVCS